MASALHSHCGADDVATVDVGLRQGVSASARERGADQPRIRNAVVPATTVATVEIVAACTGTSMVVSEMGARDSTGGITTHNVDNNTLQSSAQ